MAIHSRSTTQDPFGLLSDDKIEIIFQPPPAPFSEYFGTKQDHTPRLLKFEVWKINVWKRDENKAKTKWTKKQQ